ncbi:hypothetical protein TrVE_jg11165 [Triparma verrucosa]|uniref:Pectinesterase inhibitor domain-containing protein n=2 Tax=Triparma TaxID=722752 RepID=A0A9W6ZYE8_9STRA|nr:hypothetical protein TrST_g10576 [Triparma strigata]GMH84071.1 hypothetical protein TrVE_jg11165 [Triparma verrucosa]
MWQLTLALVLLLLLPATTGFRVCPRPPSRNTATALYHHKTLAATTLALSILFSSPPVTPPAIAATATTEDVKIQKGYAQITNLLDTWVESTTNCKTSNDNPYKGNCDRTPIKVMEVLGYKSTTSPLFNAEKTLLKVQLNGELDKVLEERWGGDAKKIRSEELRFQSAVDNYIEAANQGSDTAYISSWGESNPGGGKDRIELFIERSKKDVINCQANLKVIAEILDIKL